MFRAVKLCYLILLLLSFGLISCNKKLNESKINLNDTDKIVQLISPIKLNTLQTEIHLSDYIFDFETIKDISFSSDGINYDFKNIEKIISIISEESYPPIFNLKIESNYGITDIPIYRSEKEKYTFTFDPQGENYKEVKMKGEMNVWNQNAKDFDLIDGKYQMSFYIEPGEYQYKMVLDGKELCDFNNPDSISNGMGGFNSLLKNKLSNEKELKMVCSPVNYDPEDNFYTLEFPEAIPDYLMFYANNELTQTKKCSDSDFKTTDDGVKFIELKIPSNLKSQKRAYLRIFAFKGKQKSNDIKIPLEQGAIFTNTQLFKRTDFEKTTLYNVFVDRFYDGAAGNNKPITDGSVLPKANNLGGDIQGAVQKIKDGYFKEIGINSIWISPIVKNAEGPWGYWKDPETKFSSYHGYWPVSFTEVEPKLTTEQALHELVQVAHENDMNVFLDFVANHVHENHPFYQENKHLATDLYLPDGSLNTERWDEHRLTTWFDTFMPTLDLSKPECYEMLADSAVYWIKKYNFDGFRHDATKHVPEIFWRTLTRKLKEEVVIPENRPLYQIGETYGTRELVGSYVNSGQLNAQFDFNVYDDMVSALVGDGKMEKIDKSVKASIKAFGSNHLMGNITGNQDRARFASYAGGDLKFSEDAKKEGWTRKVGMGSEIAYEKMKLLFSLIATVPGVPVVFYGDEIAMVGGGDPDNRKMMRFNNLKVKEVKTKDVLKKLLEHRTASMALLYGDFQTHFLEEEVYAFSRNYFNKSELVIINNSQLGKDLIIPLNESQKLLEKIRRFNDFKIEIENNELKIFLPPSTFEIISFSD